MGTIQSGPANSREFRVSPTIFCEVTHDTRSSGSSFPWAPVGRPRRLQGGKCPLNEKAEPLLMITELKFRFASALGSSPHPPDLPCANKRRLSQGIRQGMTRD